MKLLKPPDSDYWHVAVTTEDGREQHVNLFANTRAEAQQIIKEAKIPEIQAASKAHRLTAEVVTLITANRKITVKDAIIEYAEWSKIGARSQKTRYNNLLTINQWAREMLLEDKTISTVTTDDIHGWINRAGDSVKGGTRMLRLSAVRALMKYCLIKRYILSDPSQLVRVDFRALSHQQRETKHKQVFTDDEIIYLLSSSDEAEPPSITPGFFRAAIILGRDLGIRLGDICNLEWGAFDYAARTVSIWTGKSGCSSRVEIPLTARVVKLMVSLPATDKQYVFQQERKIINDPKTRAALSMAFKRFFERLGFEGYSFHCLRSSLATTMAMKGATMDEIAKALGHKGTQVTKAYVRKPGAAEVAVR